ncbi:hypothetical protein OEA41_005637 [Lepraria neglecta]|uniref:PD-(D/E)XK nuclease-like domain-containing protein n=1 Tax=Lepraria neglecta TaxID=209136 RepID=A0AAE0DJX4_9LECA|nr:hypothetical protein OEA41_005637 [Lepraria neglecta]
MDLDYQDHEATPRSRKRNRKGGYRPASLSEATSSIQFSQPESPARSNSPVKDLLNELRSAKPTIDYQQLDGVNLPATVRELIQKLNTDFGQAYVPLGLKAKLEEAATSAQFAKESIYNRNNTLVEVGSLWEEVMEIYDEARCCKVYSRDEGAWSSKVVQPLMTLALDKKSIFQWENITTQGFDRCFLPRTNYLPISKKADLAWTFSRKHPEVAPLYQRLSLAGQGTSLSHLMDPYTSKLAVYNGFEIKKTAGSEDESLAQLAIFLACLLRNMKDLRRRAQRKGGNTLVREGRAKATTPLDDSGSGPAAQENRDNEHIEVLPVLGWTIVGHHWSTYIAWSSPEDGENVVSFFTWSHFHITKSR